MSLAKTHKFNMDITKQLAKNNEENLRLTEEKNDIIREFNTRMKAHLEEVRALKEVNARLQTELEDLHDLCCYLDDDRVKCRNLAKEWQHYGQYAASILSRKESCYQEEVKTLNLQKETVIAENMNLKKICRELENRPSASSIPPREYVCIRCSQRLSLENTGLNRVSWRNPCDSTKNQKEKADTDVESSSFFSNGSILSQDSYGEGCIAGHKTGKRKKVSFIEPNQENDAGEVKHEPILDVNSNVMKENRGILRNGMRRHHIHNYTSTTSNESTSSLHEIDGAMQALQIHAQLDGKSQERTEQLKENEVAVLKEMCNVVWRKLSNDEPSRSSNTGGSELIDNDIVYEDLL